MSTDICMDKCEKMVVYHLLENVVGKWMEPDEFAGRFSRKFPGATEPLKTKLVLFSRSKCSKRKFVFHFFKATVFDTSFRFSLLYFLLMELICANAWNGERDSGTKFTNPECRHHLHLHVLYLEI